MSITVCLAANTLYYPTGGGHQWVYLNWSLGLRLLGCRVIWLEGIRWHTSVYELQMLVAALKGRLERYGLADSVALWSQHSEAPTAASMEGCSDLEAASEADLLLNQRYNMTPEVVGRFRRSALLDIDPSLTQLWMSQGHLRVAQHDIYFTIGETVGQREARFPDVGLKWQYTPPCVALDWWLPYPAVEGAPFTTISHWYGNEWMEDAGEVYANNKRDGFSPFLDLPSRTAQLMELALNLGTKTEDDHDRATLLQKGWRIRHAYEVTSTPWDYQRYIQSSRGEFSCVKPSCVRLQNAWISDRTICYLGKRQASGSSAYRPEPPPS